MKLEEYTKAIEQRVIELRTTTQGERIAERAAREIAEIEMDYRKMIPVAHQPLTDEQHLANYRQYNPLAQILQNKSDLCLAIRDTFTFIGLVIATVFGYWLHMEVIPIIPTIVLGICAIVIATVLIYETALRRRRKRAQHDWLITHPYSSRAFWYITDYDDTAETTK